MTCFTSCGRMFLASLSVGLSSSMILSILSMVPCQSWRSTLRSQVLGRNLHQFVHGCQRLSIFLIDI